MQNETPSSKHKISIVLIPFVILILSAMACNLSSPPPPTVPPRLSTSTPQATIGISTQVPIALPTGVGELAPSDPSIDALLQQVNTANMMKIIEDLVSFDTRHVNSTRSDGLHGIEAAREYIYETFQSYNPLAQGRLTVWQHPFTMTWGEQETLQHNVAAILQGTDVGAGVIVIAAHYDSITTDWENGQVNAPGADDNGSGISVLLELARIMSQTPHRATLVFVAFSAEETGRQGSIRFVDEFILGQGIDVRAVLTMDIIGGINGDNGEVNDYQLRIFSADENTSPSRQLSRYVNLTARTYVPALQVVIQPTGDRQGRWGDHFSFNSQGFPAVRMMEAVEDRTRQHNERDTIDRISPSYLTRAAQVVLSSLATLADGLQPPNNLSLRQNAADGTGQTLVWTPVEGAAGYVVALRQPNALTYNQVLTVGPINSLTWDGFRPERFEALAIATLDESGKWGPFSTEYVIP